MVVYSTVESMTSRSVAFLKKEPPADLYRSEYIYKVLLYDLTKIIENVAQLLTVPSVVIFAVNVSVFFKTRRLGF